MDNLLCGLDALLVTNPTNIRYLTGFSGVSKTEREAYVLVTADQAFLFTNSIYLEQSRRLELSNCYIVTLLQTDKPVGVVEISKEYPITKALSSVILGLKQTRKETAHGSRLGSRVDNPKVGFEDTDLTVAELEKLKDMPTGGEMIATRNRVEELRKIKRKEELEQIKLAAKLTDDCFTFILKRIRPGMSETRLSWDIEGFIRARGGTLAFEPIVAFNEHSSMPHYQSRDTLPLRRGSIILLDFGARVNGYCSDMTRMVFLGPPKDVWKRTHDTVLSAQKAAVSYLESCYHVPLHDNKKHIQPTVISGAHADRIAKDIIAKDGLVPYAHSLGHCVGLDIHEAPRLTAAKDETLTPGMTFTVEPGVYIEGQYGIRIEDLVVLKESGVEILSKSPKEMMVL